MATTVESPNEESLVGNSNEGLVDSSGPRTVWYKIFRETSADNSNPAAREVGFNGVDISHNADFRKFREKVLKKSPGLRV